MDSLRQLQGYKVYTRSRGGAKEQGNIGMEVRKGNLFLTLDQLGRTGGVIHGERVLRTRGALVPLLDVMAILVILVAWPRRQVKVERVK